MRSHRVSSRAYVAAVLTALSLAIPAAGQSARHDKFAALKIKNFGRTTDTYYRGAQPKGQDYADLAAFGVKTVIDLQKDYVRDEASAVQRAGMKFYRIPMTTHEPPTAEQLALFLKLINDPANQPVYVHCAGGRHRTGVMTALHRMIDQGWTADQAYQEMRQFNFGPSFLHPEFKALVYDYYARLERSRVAPVQAAATLQSTK